MVELIGRFVTGREAFQTAAGNEKHVLEAVVIIIEERYATSQRFDDELLRSVAAAIEYIVESRFGGNIEELRGWLLTPHNVARNPSAATQFLQATIG